MKKAMIIMIVLSVLKELGKISTKLGTTIVSAAIIDDVIGIVVLSVVATENFADQPHNYRKERE